MSRTIVVVSVHLNHIPTFTVTFSLATIAQVPDFPDASWCFILLNVPPNLTIYFMIPRFVLSAVLFILALTQTLKESVTMYKATKQWQPNRYMMLLVKDGIIYFFTYVDRFLRLICPLYLPQHLPRCVIFLHKQTTQMISSRTRSLLYNTAETILSTTEFTTSNPSMIFLDSFIYLIFATIMPRFIIGVRELYDHDLRARWQGIDSGFGVLSQSIVSQNGVVSTIAFADVASGQDQVVEGDADDLEGIRLGVVAEGVRQV